MEQPRHDPKTLRLLSLQIRLIQHEILNKATVAQEFGVTERSVQRDIEVLRCFFAEQMPPRDLIYDTQAKGYRLAETTARFLSNSEILAVCKILLESRSMVKEEMLPILDRLIACCIPEQNKRAVSALIANEKFHYIQPHHGHRILDSMWELGQAIQGRKLLEITYTRLKEPHEVTRLVEPVGLMFSEYYFYLTAFLRNVDREAEFENKDDLFPTIYRLDRIQSFRVRNEHFEAPYKDRFEEGEFRKRVQFMYGGKLEHVIFRYVGLSLEAVLDRLPTAKIVSQDSASWTIEAEIFGKGVMMWLKSQGDCIQLIEVRSS